MGKKNNSKAAETKKANSSAEVTDAREDLTEEELGELFGGGTSQNFTDRNVVPMNIEETDNVTISYVKGGKTYTTTFKASSVSLDSLFQKRVECGSGPVTGNGEE